METSVEMAESIGENLRKYYGLKAGSTKAIVDAATSFIDRGVDSIEVQSLLNDLVFEILQNEEGDTDE